MRRPGMVAVERHEMPEPNLPSEMNPIDEYEMKRCHERQRRFLRAKNLNWAAKQPFLGLLALWYEHQVLVTAPALLASPRWTDATAV